MSAPILSDEKVDALREIVNIAMGRAGDALARLLDHFIELPVPDVRLVDASRVLDDLRTIAGSEAKVDAVRQAFTGTAPGECLVLYGSQSLADIAEITGRDLGEGGTTEEELALDMTNLLVGACVGGIAEQLGQEVGYSPPSILARNRDLDGVLDPASLPWQNALLVTVNFKVEGKSFVAHIRVFWPDSALEKVSEQLGAFLEALT